MLDDQTVIPAPKPTAACICPSCKAHNPLDLLVKREYRCLQCQLELAHLDYTQNGDVRGVFGWLLSPDVVLQGRYQVQSVLGKGGFGAVYLVADLRLSHRPCALKEVPTMLFDEQESLLLTKLNHPAIPGIIDHWAADGMAYQVLKFGGKRTLGGERLQCPDGRIPLDKLIPWMRQLCEVLAYLHGRSPPIIHRDLKPDNILLNEDGRIMLIDFGIAKETPQGSVTRTLGRAASLSFSPPEQVFGTGTDERSDIYALGATFYALLTGQNPPPAHERVAGQPLPPPSQFVAGLNPAVEKAVIQSLSLNKDHRQPSVQAFAVALERAGAAAKKPKPKLLLPLAGVAGLLVVAASAYFYVPKPATTSETPSMQSAPTPVAAPPVVSPANPTPDSATEMSFWGEVKDSRDTADLTAYLKKFPTGLHAELAQNKLVRLKPAIKPTIPAPTPKPVCDDCPEMVQLPGGEFWMGSDDNDKDAQSDEKPKHKVQVAPFSIGKYEVTRGQYAVFVKDTGRASGPSCWGYDKSGSWGKQDGADWRKPGFNQEGNHPVVCVSYDDALAYIQWLNQKTGQVFRLPTEAEWEYAARGGTDTIRFWGDNPDEACRYANIYGQTAKAKLGYSWTEPRCPDGYVYTAPVGSFQANDFKLNDMLGNVREWTCSDYEDKYAGGEKKCLGNNGAKTRRVLRGGSWGDGTQAVRSADRNRDTPDFRYNYFIGFRLAQDH